MFISINSFSNILYHSLEKLNKDCLHAFQFLTVKLIKAATIKSNPSCDPIGSFV